MVRNDLVDRLRSSRNLQQPTASETQWFNCQARADSTPAPLRRRCASVALVLRQVDDKVEMLVIKRTINRRDKWSGHIALPGGRQDPGETELQAAVRECKEEVGISLVPSRFALLGRLEDSKTSTRKDAITVACFVFVQTDGSDLPITVQASEVAFAWWTDTAMFYPDPAPQEVGFDVASMVRAARKPHWKALMWLLRAKTAFFPCFFLPPPSVSGQPHVHHVHHSGIVPTSVEYPLDAKVFVMWGLTFGVVSDLVEAGGGRAFAYQGPPYFRFRSIGADALLFAFYGLRGWTFNLRGALASSWAMLRLRQ